MQELASISDRNLAPILTLLVASWRGPTVTIKNKEREQTLITSANLSYHGQEGNIELGTLVESRKISKQVDDIFTHLIFSKIVHEV